MYVNALKIIHAQLTKTKNKTMRRLLANSHLSGGYVETICIVFYTAITFYVFVVDLFLVIIFRYL